MMNLERLRVLDAVARHGSVGGAAEALHVTTSAVSQQLAKLEREAGERLLARHGRGVRLTDAGLLLAGHAARILAQAERARAELEARRGAVAGELRVAAFPTAARGLLPGALAALRERHPGLRVRSWEVDPGAAVVGVARGDHDLAVVLDWHDRPLAVPEGLRTASLLDDPAEAALPAGHRLAGAAEIDLAELAGEEWITWGAGEFCHEWLLATLRARGVEPDIAHRAPETHTQLALVAAGLGVCVVPALGREPVPAGVVTVPLRPRVSRHVYAVWRGDADRRPAIGAVVGALRAQGTQGEGAAWERPLPAR